MKRLIIKLFHFELMQKKWGRKWMKGTYYQIFTPQLMMAPFWSDEIITSCQSKLLETESY